MHYVKYILRGLLVFIITMFSSINIGMLIGSDDYKTGMIVTSICILTTIVVICTFIIVDTIKNIK